MPRVLVFPSINEPGLEVARALLSSPRFEVVGGSSYDIDHDPSRLLLQRHLRLPALGDEGFRQRFEAVLRDQAIDVVVPTVDALIETFATWDTAHVTFVTPTAELAAVCASKSATYARLEGIVPLARVYDEDADVEYPAFAKPDRGGGGRGAMLVDAPDALAVARRRGLIVMEFLPGEEYTVDCCGDRAGRLMTAHVRRRAVVGRGGIALASAAEDHPDIVAHVEAIAANMPIAGPWFAQFKRDSDNTPRLMEVNARVGGSMGLTRLAGTNIPAMAVWSALGVDVTVPRRRPGTRILRSLQSLGEERGYTGVIWDLDDTLYRPDGRPDPDQIALVIELRNQGLTQVVLSRNPDPLAALARERLDGLFDEIVRAENKLVGFDDLLRRHDLSPSTTVMINDSNVERTAFEARYPDLRVLTPDMIGVLWRRPR
jgi:hypothetical protein